MSGETYNWLNNNILIGFETKRGKAWHYKKSAQGSEPNHYPLAIPLADVKRRLFDWVAQSVPLWDQVPVMDVSDADSILPDGTPFQWRQLDDRQLIRRSDTFAPLGVFKAGYEIHQYEEWLLNTVANILDDDLSIGSAGLLKGGAQAWVSVEVPETIKTPEGVDFRPNLLAATSMDGSLATTFTRVVTVTVCDNTMSAALREQGQKIKVRHTKYSGFRLHAAREALNIIHDTAEDFMAEVKELCETTVTDKQWTDFLDSLSPLPEVEVGKKRGTRGLTQAINKREALTQLWNSDNRVSPWRNTAWGVIAAVNTHEHHNATVRSSESATRSAASIRTERNMQRAITGGVDKLDIGTLELLRPILANV